MTIFGDPIWAEMLSLANVVFGLMMFYFSLGRARIITGFLRTLMLVAALIGLYWAVIYSYVFLVPSNNPVIDSITFGQVFVRPMFTFTMATMATISYFRWRRK